MEALKFRIPQYQCFTELPLPELDEKGFSIYVIDYDWNYLFANKSAVEKTKFNPTGKNVRTIWQERPEYNFQPIFNLLKEGVEERKSLDIKSRSPLTKKAIEIVGHPLSDCYYFSVYELPDKESLLSELKSILKNRI